MPWIHFHVAEKGTVKACCIANIPYGNVNTNSLEEIWNGKPVQALREKFLKGEKDNRCSGCYKLEEGGGTSIRQETFDKFPEIKPTDIKTEEKPIYFDIRFSNVCNFRCRTCWHGASSKWFKDAKALGINLGDSAIIQNINDFNNFISKMGDSLLQAKEIYFAGGEPLVTEEHYLLLDWLLVNKVTNIKLRYNTNFSILEFKQYEILKYWQKFKNVEILASIDATEKLGEYIRKEFDWNIFLKNREKIEKLPNVTFKIAPTVSVFNIKHLPDLYKKALKLNIINSNDLYINILERPFYYNVKILPPEEKQIITQKFEEFYVWLNEKSISGKIENLFKECISFMNSEDLHAKYWKQYTKETEKLDGLSSRESLATL